MKDKAQLGRLPNRTHITCAEAPEIVLAVGWRAAYYLDALAQKLSGVSSEHEVTARRAVESAVDRLLERTSMVTFGTWEEHLRKHYRDPERTIAFAALENGFLHPRPAWRSRRSGDLDAWRRPAGAGQ